MTYGTSPLSAIASVQPIDEERGTVYYKQVLAMTTRGSMMQGQAIWDTTGMPQTFVKGYASSAATVVLESQAASAASFNFPTQLAAAGYLPLRPGKVAIVVKSTPPLHAADYNMDGNLLGAGIYGTVDYQTGEVNLTLDATAQAAVTGPVDIVAIIDQVMEGAPNIPQINYVLASKAVVANLFALKDTVDTCGVLQ